MGAAQVVLAIVMGEPVPTAATVIAPLHGCMLCGLPTDGGLLHAHTCTTGRHHRTARHNALRNTVAALARGIRPHMDAYFHRRAGAPGAVDKRADVMLASTTDGSFRRFVDVTVGAPRITLPAAQRTKEGATAAPSC